MEIQDIKNEILRIKPIWRKLGDSYDDDKYSEIHERDIYNMIIAYYEEKQYTVEGFPFEKRLLAETNEFYDDDYFCFERYLKYIDVLATIHQDVLEILYFFTTTMWDVYEGSKEEYKSDILAHLKVNSYDIEF